MFVKMNIQGGVRAIAEIRLPLYRMYQQAIWPLNLLEVGRKQVLSLDAFVY